MSKEPRMLVSGVSERDIDLLLLEEFIASLDFATWFWRQTGGGESDVVEVVNPRRSVTHSLGESDLQVALRDSEGSLHCLLIENKVAANMQPTQAERYRLRGEELLQSGEYADVGTVLVAPESYLGPEGEPHGFDARVSYESDQRLVRLANHPRHEVRLQEAPSDFCDREVGTRLSTY